MTVDECLQRADDLLDARGICLLMFDIENSRQDEGFYFVGDCGYVAVNDAEVVTEIIAQLQDVEAARFHYAVAEDCYDSVALKMNGKLTESY